MRRIFISHSTDKSDTAGKQYVLDVADGLQRAGFEVFLDRKSLEGGDDWSFKIANYLGYSQGAVLLLSKRALMSKYVQAEASDLFFRWRREGNTPEGMPKFPFVPILLTEKAKTGAPDDGNQEQDALKAELLQDTGFWQAIGFTANQVDDPLPAADLVTRLVKTFDRLPDLDPSGPLEEVEIKIGDILQRAPGFVKVLARKANPQLAANISAEEAGRHLARKLLTCSLTEAYQLLTAFGGSLPQEDLLNVFQLVAPSWVSPEAALCLAALLEKPTAAACAVMNAALPEFTPFMYVCRARARQPDDAALLVRVRDASTATYADDELYVAALENLASTLNCDVDASDAASLTRLQKELAATLEFQPVVIVVPVSPADLESIASLRKKPEFEGATFLALCEPMLPDTLAPGLVGLEPLLQEGREASAEQAYRRVRDKLYPGNMRPRRSP